jgi:hypothetical protein
MALLAPLATDELIVAGSRFRPATAELMQERALQRRVDSKYTCGRDVLHEIVSALSEDYAALPAGHGNFATYRSLYFDTPERRCFHDHRRGRRLRQKIRIRHYPDRRLSFLEVKTKRNEVVTDKQRLALDYGAEALGAVEERFLRTCSPIAASELLPVLRIDFLRLSLVGLRSQERVTIDTDLWVREPSGLERSFGPLSVIEVKQAPYCVRTPVMRQLSAAGLREQSMSKYTLATALLHPELRQNRLRQDVRAIERMLQ